MTQTKPKNGAPSVNPMALTGAEAQSYIERRLCHPVETLLRFPKYFLIETVNTCNARCIMCGIDFDNKSKKIMEDDLFAKITDEIGRFKDHVEKVMLYLDGEPLIDKKLAKRVAQMKQAGVRKVNIATNASLLTEKRTRELIEAGLDEVYITLDSLIPEVYEAIRVRLDYEEVYNNILDFIRLRNELNPDILIRIQMVQQELNKDEPEAFCAHWKDKLADTDQIVVQKAHNWANAVDVIDFGDEDDVNNDPCIALWGTFVVHVDGTAPLCCMDTDTQEKVGDVQQQSIEDVWRGAALERIRNLHTSGQRHHVALCDGCTLWRETKHSQDETPDSAS